jgi:hypothetical protein
LLAAPTWAAAIHVLTAELDRETVGAMYPT